MPVELPSSVDAMIVPSEDGRLSILLNRSITQHERQNFSICHEIVHTFSQDCADFIRMRAKRHETAGPEMEVEVLCNIAESVPDDSCVYVAVETNEVTSGERTGNSGASCI